jgi:hypothetical protein
MKKSQKRHSLPQSDLLIDSGNDLEKQKRIDEILKSKVRGGKKVR